MVDPFGLCGENANDQGSFWSNFTAHDWLGLAGIALNAAGPYGMVAAAVCDMIDAGLYFKEGETVKGVISLVCAIPGIGDVVGVFRQGTKLAKVAKVVGTTIRAAQKMYVTTASASKALDMAGDAKIEYAVNGGEMTSSVRRKILGSAAMAGVSILLGKSLMKDARSFAKTAEIRFNTTSKETADAISGKNVDYRKTENGYFDNGERIATRKQVRKYKKQMKERGINVVVDKKNKRLPYDKAAGFDYSNGTIYIRKNPGVIDLYHEAFHAQQYLDIGQESYRALEALEREEYVYNRLMEIKQIFNEVELLNATKYINRLRDRGGK